MFTSYRARIQSNWETTLGVRETLIDGAWSPFLPSLGVAYRPYPAWKLKAKAARSYRVPTFNDLYWRGGSGTGNPDLNPELGWTYEVGLGRKTVQESPTQLSAELTAFSNHIQQWIHWVPNAADVWSPRNVDRVWARGLELDASLDHSFGNQLSTRVWASYTYTKSTAEETTGNPASLGKQLIYTPYHQAKTSLQLRYHSLTLGYSGVRVGRQFTTASNRRSLPAYLVHDLSLTWNWPIFRRHLLLINGQVRNLSDQTYDVREGYPMPGRSYQLSLTYQFNQ